MNKTFEKILKKLEELQNNLLSQTEDDINVQVGIINGVMYSKKIVQEVAEEYEDGWIPCSDRLPEDDSICIVTVEYPNNETVVNYGWFDRIRVCWYVGMQEFRTSNVLAWQPLPEAYKRNE